MWFDAQLSPKLATWLERELEVEAHAVRDLGLLRASDERIFSEARKASAVVVTKDRDFVNLLERHGPPPQILWLTCGNTSERQLRTIFSARFADVRGWLEQGEPLVEIAG